MSDTSNDAIYRAAVLAGDRHRAAAYTPRPRDRALDAAIQADWAENGQRGAVDGVHAPRTTGDGFSLLKAVSDAPRRFRTAFRGWCASYADAQRRS